MNKKKVMLPGLVIGLSSKTEGGGGGGGGDDGGGGGGSFKTDTGTTTVSLSCFIKNDSPIPNRFVGSSSILAL